MTQFNMKITNKNGPNVTVLLPGCCNARCNFCFWNRETDRNGTSFVADAIRTLKKLPERTFRVLSISGGEPTLSPVLLKFLLELNRLRRSRKFQRVVLTTNGAMFAGDVDEVKLRIILSAVDHINISRHAADDKENSAIFKTRSVPNTAQLAHAVRLIHDLSGGSVDVTLNCVHPEDVSSKFCRQFIKYAKSIGADSVSFRKEAGLTPVESGMTSAELLTYHKNEGHVAPCAAERRFVRKYGKGQSSRCPVCRSRDMDVDGFPVRWKGSVTEPSVVTGGVYEVVIDSDGKPYADWSRGLPIDLPRLVAGLERSSNITLVTRGNGSGGTLGCGDYPRGPC